MHAEIFDVDGTLLRSVAVDDLIYRQAVIDVLGPVKIRGSLGDYEFVTDSGVLAQIMDDNDVDSDSDIGSKIKSHFLRALESHVRDNGPFREVPGARKILDQLRASTVHRVAIATGGWRESALLKLQSAGIDLSGIPIATSDDSNDRTEIMQLALSKLGCNFESITYYGDGPWDKKACAELGWNFVAVGPALNGVASYDEIILASIGTATTP